MQWGQLPLPQAPRCQHRLPQLHSKPQASGRGILAHSGMTHWQEVVLEARIVHEPLE